MKPKTKWTGLVLWLAAAMLAAGCYSENDEIVKRSHQREREAQELLVAVNDLLMRQSFNASLDLSRVPNMSDQIRDLQERVEELEAFAHSFPKVQGVEVGGSK